MAWEFAAVIICLVPLAHWIFIDRKYTSMTRRFDGMGIKIEKHMIRRGIDNNSHGWDEYCDRLQTIASLKRTCKMCRRIGRRGILITCAMSFAGAVVIGIINTDPIFKWLVFMVCAAPIYSIVTHFRDIFGMFVQTTPRSLIS